METDKTIDELIKLPHKFNSVGNVSFLDLLKETGYFNLYSQVSVERIHDRLLLAPEYAKDWIVYSEDKRSSSGWYFKNDKQGYVVGFLGNKGEKTCSEFDNYLEACALFIKNEVEDIRNTIKKL